MRKSLGRTTLALAAIGLMSAVSFSGCSTSSGFKMPSSDWLSWGKKKPADTSLASRTGLPAPPSSLASPNTVPSYAQGPGGTSGTYATAQNRGLTAGSTAAAPASYGMQPGAPSNYGNTSYGAVPGSATGASPSPSYGGAGTSQGFYSPDYRGAAGSTGAASPYAGQANPARPASGMTADPYGAYSQGGYAGSSQPSPAYNQGGALAPAPYGAATNGYGQASAPAAPNGNYNYGGNRGTDSYATGGSAYGGASAGSIYGQTPSNAGAVPAAQEMPPAGAAAGGYRPGSTARSTQFGTSDNLNVPGGESVQPASFAGGSQGSGSSLYAPGPVGSNGSYPASEVSPTRTATEAGSSYPSTYQR